MSPISEARAAESRSPVSIISKPTLLPTVRKNVRHDHHRKETHMNFGRTELGGFFSKCKVRRADETQTTTKRISAYLR